MNAAPQLIDVALRCANVGWWVFPLGIRSKVTDSTLAPHSHKSASNDPEQIKKWWTASPGANIGIDLGRSGLTVLDFDNGLPPVELGLSDKFQVSTSRGTHVYFVGVSKQGDMYFNGQQVGEVKSDGGYILSPFSVHPDGSVYTMMVQTDITPPPDGLIERLRPERKSSPNIEGEKIPRGQHDTELTRIAGKLRQAGAEEEAIYTALVEVCEKRCEGYGPDYLDMCRKIAHSVRRYPVGQNTDLLLTQTPAQPEPQTAQATGKRLNVRGATSFSTKKIKWLWPHRVPLGKLTLFVGVPGGGKSLAAGDVAARLSVGKNWYDSDNVFQPSETLMLVGEDDIEDTTIPRLQAAGADLSKIHFLKSVITMEGEGKTTEERELQFDKDLIHVEEFLSSHPNIRLIVVDPVSNYMGSAKMNSEQEVRAVLIPLKNLAERLTVALIGIMHLNKKNETSAINRVGGAMAFVGVARAAYLFQKSEEENGYLEDQHFMVLLKCNITKKVDGLVYEISARQVDVEGSPEWMPYIKFTSTTTKNAEGLLQPKSETAGRPPVQSVAVKEWLKAFLSDGPVRSSEVIKAGKELHNFSKGTIERARTELAVTSGKEGKLWLWSLPIQEEAVTVSLDAK